MQESGPGRAVLVVVAGDSAGVEFELAAEETLIGRGSANDVALADASASRQHAIVARDPGEGAYTIEDLQSTNGTLVNGKRIRSAALADGDEIQIGHTRFRFFFAARVAPE